MGGGSDLCDGGQVGGEGFGLGCAHLSRGAQFVEVDETFVPVETGFVGAIGVSAQADGFAEAVGDFLLRHDLGLFNNYTMW
jgi:hypothetical protein